MAIDLVQVSVHSKEIPGGQVPKIFGGFRVSQVGCETKLVPIG